MAKESEVEKKFKKVFLESVRGNTGILRLGEEDVQNPDQSPYKQLLGQRQNQRNIIFWFSIIMSFIAFVILVTLYGLQMSYRSRVGKDLLSQSEINIFAVSVFVQVIGVIVIITRSLWNEEPFMKIHEKEFDKSNGH